MAELYIATLNQTPGPRPHWFRDRQSASAGSRPSSGLFERHPSGTKRRRSTAFHSENNGTCIRGVRRNQRIARHVVARGHGEPFFAADGSGPLFSIIASTSAALTSRV